jgi:hypothetical protein
MNCKEATELLVKKQEGQLGFLNRIRLKYHTLACRFCRLFGSQSASLDYEIKQNHEHQADDVHLSDESKLTLKNTVDSELGHSHTD